MHDFNHALMSATELVMFGKELAPCMISNALMSATGLGIFGKELAPCMISIMP